MISSVCAPDFARCGLFGASARVHRRRRSAVACSRRWTWSTPRYRRGRGLLCTGCAPRRRNRSGITAMNSSAPTTNSLSNASTIALLRDQAGQARAARSRGRRRGDHALRHERALAARAARAATSGRVADRCAFRSSRRDHAVAREQRGEHRQPDGAADLAQQRRQPGGVRPGDGAGRSPACAC